MKATEHHTIYRISNEEAYRLICTMASNDEFQNSVSARGWILYASYIRTEMMVLIDGSVIYRSFEGLSRIMGVFR